MNSFSCHSTLRRLAPILLGGLALCCGGGGGDGAAGSGSDFHVSYVSLAPGSTWLINRPITIEFDQPVNFGTVSLNSINIRQVGGTPAIGEFSLLNPTTISFQPLCPRLSDFSDAGLLPGGVQYELRILGQSAYSVRSTSGAILATSEQREFSTPNSIEPAELFFDTVAGAPNPVVRSEGSLATDASYVEIGSDPNSRAYFERAPTGLVSLENGLLLPHNLLSDSATHVAFLIAFNQPVDPSNSNLDSSRVRLEYRKPTPPPGGWVPLVSHSTLEQNCAGTGSLVRIEPVGALPSGADLRVFLAPEFRDIVGQKSAFAQTAFAPASTTAALATQADSLEEEFTAGAGQPGSQEDQNLPLGLPLAQWGGGSLAKFGRWYKT